MTNKPFKVTKVKPFFYEVRDRETEDFVGEFYFYRTTTKDGAETYCHIRACDQKEEQKAYYAYFKDIKKDAEYGNLFN